jgi:transcription-repair coupling factor (superfamily II helicase)
MNLSTLLRLFNQIDLIQNLFDDLALDGSIEHNPWLKHPLGVPLAARPAFLAALHQNLQRPILFITARTDRARALTDQLRLWSINPDQVLRLPDPTVLPYERIAWNLETLAKRVATLTKLATQTSPDTAPLVVTSARALMQKTMPSSWVTNNIHCYQIGQQINMTETLQIWIDLGYQQQDLVEDPGQFSYRGGILDIFPASEPSPIRIELFGDEIDSLRTFDPITQRSEARLDQFTIGPALEALPTFAQRAAEALQTLDISNLQPMAEMSLREQIEALENGITFRGLENYLPFMTSDLANLLDYLPEDGLVVIENPVELEEIIRDLEEQASTLKDDLITQHELPLDWPQPNFTWDDIYPKLIAFQTLLLGFDGWLNNALPAEDHPFPVIFPSPPIFGGQVKPAIENMLQRREAGERVVVVSRQASRLSHLLENEDVMAAPVNRLDYPPAPGSITIINGTLLEGWLLRADVQADPLLTILTDVELFGVRKPQVRRRPAKHRGVTPETFFADVKSGDYVVHVEHGIGIFQGLVKLSLDSVEREYLAVRYGQDDKLYVPIHQADRLARYVGVDDTPPVLNRLGTTEWARTKKRAKAAAADVAQELLEIYATRTIAEGRAFSPDSIWQRELEDSFPYVETEDQYLAIQEVKVDMERPKPMDRLICGDVGYGKTEVALRAAFKAVMDGVQVALLVPTTVLAQQHYNTFKERLASFPVRVEMLSRFRTRREIDEILTGLATGSVDIVIGTHRLLQKDVAFKELGLLIIDEEQRFGVMHKERLKEMKTDVDTLALSATPIPRTLHMALTGIRDVSIIDTPPEERLPIKTTIAPTDDTLIRTAILREIDRGGQIYFVHNRVMGIEQTANHLRNIVPEAHIRIGHGQMPERRLEKVMVDFAAGEFDVLVSTTIIESGLDIPNVNTIIINRAEQFGLAQLYQLRGRVGRAATQSYAYLLVPRKYKLPEIARRRLEAIREASELGAGFKIAMRDLEIRGAGELLGAKQHGHIGAVGFDLYVRLLAQAVQELQGADPLHPADQSIANYLNPLGDSAQINLPIPVYVPEDYLPEDHLRLKLYRRMATLTKLEEVEAMGQELEDRFGKLPEPVMNLLYQLKLKILSRAAGVQSLGIENDQIVIKADSLEKIDRRGLQRRMSVGTRIGRRQAWIPLHADQTIWQAEIEKVLIHMDRLLNTPAGPAG